MQLDQRFDATMALSRAERDFQLSPSRSAKDAAGFLLQMVTRTEQLAEDADIWSRRDVAYGSHPAARLDVFAPKSVSEAARPALVFIHGGFWQEGDKSVSGFAARTFVLEGWNWVSVGYALAPDATLTEICLQAADAVEYVKTNAMELGIDPSRIVLSGHSAGGHLAAAVLADIMGRGAHDAVAGVVLISGVFELAPIAASYVNDLVQMSGEEVDHLSPLRTQPKRDVPVHVLIGADEPEAFHTHSETLCALWADHLTTVTKDIAVGRDHFDVLDELTDTGSATWTALRAMI